MYFYSVESFAHGRFLSIFTAIVCSYMLVCISKKHGLSSSAAYVLGIGTFLLPPAQVNLGWIANYIPGVFNAPNRTADLIWADGSLKSKLKGIGLSEPFIIAGK